MKVKTNVFAGCPVCAILLLFVLVLVLLFLFLLVLFSRADTRSFCYFWCCCSAPVFAVSGASKLFQAMLVPRADLIRNPGALLSLNKLYTKPLFNWLLLEEALLCFWFEEVLLPPFARLGMIATRCERPRRRS